MPNLRGTGEFISNVQLFRHQRTGAFYLKPSADNSSSFRVRAADVMDFNIDDVYGPWHVSTCSRILFRRRYLDALQKMPAVDADLRVCERCRMWFDASLRGCCE